VAAALAWLAKRTPRTRVDVVSAPPLGGTLRFSDFRSKGFDAQASEYGDWIKTMRDEDKSEGNFYAPAAVSVPISNKSRALPYDVAVQRLERNVYTLTMSSSSSVRAVGLCGSVFVTVAHFVVAAAKRKEMVTLRSSDGLTVRELNMQFTPYLIHRNRDVCFFRVDKMLVKDVTWLLPVKSVATYVGFGKATLVGLPIPVKFPEVVPALVNRGDKPDTKRNMLRYTVDTHPGDCGVPVLVTAGQGSPVFVGVHAYGDQASGGSSGLAELLCFEDVPTQLDWAALILYQPLTLSLSKNGLKLTADRHIDPAPSRHAAAHWAPEAFSVPPVRFLGSIAYPQRKMPSRIVPGPLWPYVSHLMPDSGTVVPRLERFRNSSGEYVCYETISLLEYKDCASTFSREEMMSAAKKLSDDWLRFIPAGTGHVLQEAESLNGIDGVDFMYAFKRTTGCGLPLRGDKSQLVTGDPTLNNVRYTAEARNSVAFVAQALVNGTNPGIIADCCLKDAPTKPTKNPRMFAVIPFQHNDLSRRGLLPIFRLLQMHFLDTGVAIGVKADSEQWAAIATVHEKFPYHFDYDFRKFDKTHNCHTTAAVFWMFLRFMEHYYDPSDTICGLPWFWVMLNVFRAQMNLPYYSNTGVYTVTNGLPSGATITAWLNSIAQALMVVKAIDAYEAKYGVRPKYYVSIYGDDGIISVDTAGFNFFFWQEFLGERNMPITPGTKTAVPTAFVPWEKISFLKRHFVWRDSYCFAPLALKSIAKQAQWFIPSAFETTSSQLKMMVDNVGFYLAAHPCGATDVWYDVLVAAFRKEFTGEFTALPIFSMADHRARLLRTVITPLQYLSSDGFSKLLLKQKVDEVYAYAMRCP